MSIRRAPRQRNFTVLPNAALSDERLSFKARGLLAYVLSKPDHWRTNSQHLTTVGPDGLTSVRSGLQELREAGYAVLVKGRNVDGTIASEWEIGDAPLRNPTMDSPTLEQPNVGKPVSLVSTEGVKTEEVKTEIENLSHRRFSTCDGTEHECPGPFCFDVEAL